MTRQVDFQAESISGKLERYSGESRGSDISVSRKQVVARLANNDVSERRWCISVLRCTEAAYVATTQRHVATLRFLLFLYFIIIRSWPCYRICAVGRTVDETNRKHRVSKQNLRNKIFTMVAGASFSGKIGSRETLQPAFTNFST